MNHDETQALKEELEQYRKEKEQIRKLIGQIGGAKVARADTIINVLFILIIIVLFGLDIFRHVFEFKIDSFPAMLSLEIGVLLVSIKIIWMIYKQSKVEHFQFWILNSIEFRLNDIAKRTRNMEKELKKKDKSPDG